jgi:3-isopropylmalate/(R)-2-methylmalate dehydratase small subunit
MIPVRRIQGRAFPLGRDNVDTDLIIPAAHLKTVSRAGLGQHAFETLRARPGNLFDDPAFAGAPILIAGANFGCGSSREHAAWALADLGIRAVIAPSFADIFSANAYKNGIVTVELARTAVDRLMEIARGAAILVDVEAMIVAAPGFACSFALDPFRRDCLLQGLDEIALTLASEPAIRAYELRTGT